MGLLYQYCFPLSVEGGAFTATGGDRLGSAYLCELLSFVVEKCYNAGPQSHGYFGEHNSNNYDL